MYLDKSQFLINCAIITSVFVLSTLTLSFINLIYRDAPYAFCNKKQQYLLSPSLATCLLPIELNFDIKIHLKRH